MIYKGKEFVSVTELWSILGTILENMQCTQKTFGSILTYVSDITRFPHMLQYTDYLYKVPVTEKVFLYISVDQRVILRVDESKYTMERISNMELSLQSPRYVA